MGKGRRDSPGKEQSSLSRGVYTTEQKWHGSDKNWNGSNSFCKETVKSYPFCNWSIGACGPDTERIKLHCFFAKTIGTVPVFVESVPFLLCRVNAPSVTDVRRRSVLLTFLTVVFLEGSPFPLVIIIIVINFGKKPA